MQNGKNIQERTFEFSLRVLQLVGKLPQSTISFEVGKQLLRAGTSIGANVVEGQGAVSRKEFINYLQIAKKSAKETEYWLLLLIAANIISIEGKDDLLNECKELQNVLAAIVISTKKNTCN